jgi:hypothetical protein
MSFVFAHASCWLATPVCPEPMAWLAAVNSSSTVEYAPTCPEVDVDGAMVPVWACAIANGAPRRRVESIRILYVERIEMGSFTEKYSKSPMTPWPPAYASQAIRQLVTAPIAKL